jgi:hypothetical protein
MSADARLLRQRLSKVAVGQEISYEELSREIGRKVAGSCTALQSARRSLLNSSQIIFEPVRGVGLKRLSDSEIVDASERDISKVRRAARRGAKKLLSIADYSALPSDKQLQHTTRLSVMTMIAHAASDKGIEKVEKAAAGRAQELPIAETLKAFST